MLTAPSLWHPTTWPDDRTFFNQSADPTTGLIDDRARQYDPLADTVVGGQQNFRTHELIEKELMDGGMSYEQTHELALQTHTLMKNYTAEVID